MTISRKLTSKNLSISNELRESLPYFFSREGGYSLPMYGPRLFNEIGFWLMARGFSKNEAIMILQSSWMRHAHEYKMNINMWELFYNQHRINIERDLAKWMVDEATYGFAYKAIDNAR